MPHSRCNCTIGLLPGNLQLTGTLQPFWLYIHQSSLQTEEVAPYSHGMLQMNSTWKGTQSTQGKEMGAQGFHPLPRASLHNNLLTRGSLSSWGFDPGLLCNHDRVKSIVLGDSIHLQPPSLLGAAVPILCSSRFIPEALVSLEPDVSSHRVRINSWESHKQLVKNDKRYSCHQGLKGLGDLWARNQEKYI